MFPVLVGVGVTSFWVPWVFLHNGFKDSGLSLAMPYYMALAGGNPAKVILPNLQGTLSAFIKSVPLVL